MQLSFIVTGDREFIMKKINCWEFMECGRGHPSGANHNGREVCQSAKETSLDGIHGGINGGRACWAVAGSRA